ncbi:MAG: peptidoglycan-binding protein [Paracoccaceae bacterium]
MKLNACYVFAALFVLGGCETGGVKPGSPSDSQDSLNISSDVPPEAPPGTCWEKIVGPSVTKTVTEQVLVKPAELAANGQIENPPVYRYQQREAVVRKGNTTWFETLCPDILTKEFIASLQRALAARKLYTGAITGTMNTPTRSAVRKIQEPQGVNSDVLSIAAARSLGLVSIRLGES